MNMHEIAMAAQLAAAKCGGSSSIIPISESDYNALEIKPPDTVYIIFPDVTAPTVQTLNDSVMLMPAETDDAEAASELEQESEESDS